MQTNQKVLILNGSPKPEVSTSLRISEYLQKGLTQKDVKCETVRISSYLKTDNKVKELCEKIEKSQIIFLIFPLYIDSPPYNVIEAFEEIKKYLTSSHNRGKKTFIALSHCGIGVNQNHPAIKICERIAHECDFVFGGGLMLGYTGILNGVSLKYFKKMTAKLCISLDLISDAIASREKIPFEAFDLMSKPFFPDKPLFMSKLILNFMMKKIYKTGSFTYGLPKIHKMLKFFYR